MKCPIFSHVIMTHQGKRLEISSSDVQSQLPFTNSHPKFPTVYYRKQWFWCKNLLVCFVHNGRNFNVSLCFAGWGFGWWREGGVEDLGFAAVGGAPWWGGVLVHRHPRLSGATGRRRPGEDTAAVRRQQLQSTTRGRPQGKETLRWVKFHSFVFISLISKLLLEVWEKRASLEQKLITGAQGKNNRKESGVLM